MFASEVIENFFLKNSKTKRRLQRHTGNPLPDSFVSGELDQSALSYEPLFLVKWFNQSYNACTWEPLCTFKGENYKLVQAFLSENKHVKMNDRLINSKNIYNHLDLLNEEKNHVAFSILFTRQKKILDSYISS